MAPDEDTGPSSSPSSIMGGARVPISLGSLGLSKDRDHNAKKGLVFPKGHIRIPADLQSRKILMEDNTSLETRKKPSFPLIIRV